MACITWIGWVVGSVLVLASVIRWFEQTIDAVDHGAWRKLALLIVFPFAAWFYPSNVSAGRGFPVPKHEPVRGFGKMPKDATPAEAAPVASSDPPPPGTPPEFLGLPEIPLAKKAPRSPVDPDKLARLKQKMREQGMLPPDDEA